jgi:Arc/MetJ-type ribon-helix-helix transcriptional regulator
MLRLASNLGASVKVELTPDAEQWVAAEIAAGNFPTAEDAVRHAIRLAKLTALRDRLDAAVAEGGARSAGDVRRHVRQQLDESSLTPKSS